jgi:mannose-1-phosphate guanylyltransferase
LAHYHKEQKPLVTLALCDYAPKNKVSLSPDNTIVDFLGKRKKNNPSRDRNLTFTGVSIVDEGVLNLIPVSGPSHIIDIYLDLIKRQPGSIRGYVVSGEDWRDIGTPEGYLDAHKTILLDHRMGLFGENVPAENVYQGQGTRIEPGAVLEGFVSLGEKCLVEKGTFLKNCVVWDNTKVKAGTHCENGVIDGDWQYSLSI